MKILVLSQYWWPENGVPQRRWSWLTGILMEAGHEVTVIAPPPHYQRLMNMKSWREERPFRTSVEPGRGPSGELIVRSAFFPAGPSITQRAVNQATVAFGALWVVVKLPGQLKGYRPDLVIGTVPALPTAFATFLAARRFRSPYVIDLRDAWPDLLAQSDHWNSSTGKRSLREKVLRRGPLQAVSTLTRKIVYGCLRRAAGIIVTSSYFQQSLEQRNELHTGGDHPPVATIRNVFPSKTEFVKRPPPEREGDTLHVLYAGTIGRAQNLYNALAAAEHARQLGTDIKFRIVGAGVAKDALKAMAKTADIDVSFEPRREADNLREFYEWADTALVHLADWQPLNMAVPSKTYELMAMRMHITGVVHGEAADLITRLNAGHTVDPGSPEALAHLWVNLARHREKLVVGATASEWVGRERVVHSPRVLETVISQATS